MKKSQILFLFFLFLTTATWALDANISFATFKSPSGSYLELYVRVLGPSAEFVPLADSTSVQASLEVVVLFKKDGEITKFDKYQLNSPILSQASDFIDLKRYSLENGKYEVEVSINDLNQAGNAKKYNQSFEVDFAEDRVEQSDIQLLASLKKAGSEIESNPMVKSGYYLESLPSHFYDRGCERLIFYNEIYGTDQQLADDFMVSYFLEKVIGEKKSPPMKMMHKRRSPADVVPLLLQMDIVDLESGNYQLVVEVRSREGELLSKKSVYLQRSNPFLNTSREEIASGENNLANEFVAELNGEELEYSLRAISMQVSPQDGQLVNDIIRDRNLDAMRLYLFSFWAQENATNPQAAYEAYMEVARAIDVRFDNGFRHGFESDRGYVFMKYGAPNDYATVETDPNAPPYEIWFYNEFPQTNQNNVKFVFYNPALTSNGFVMLHSNARGEVSNPRWEVELYRDTNQDPTNGSFIDGTQMGDGEGRYARRIYDSF